MNLINKSEDFLDEGTANSLVGITMPCATDTFVRSRAWSGHVVGLFVLAMVEFKLKNTP